MNVTSAGRSLGCILLAVAVFGGVVPTLGADENLLDNPSFEASGSAPSRWTFNLRNTSSQITRDKGRAASGAAAVRITNPTRAESGNVIQTVRFDPPLEPGSRVTFSAMAATADLQRTGPRIIVYLEGGSGTRQTVSVGGTPGTHDFTEVRGDALAKRRTSRAVVYLCNYGVGTIWWDNATLSVHRAAAVQIPPRPAAGGLLSPLTTRDGLELALGDSGGVARVRLDDRDEGDAKSHSGLWIVPYAKSPVPVTGQLTAENGSIRQQFTSDELGLAVEAVYRAVGDQIQCTGSIADLTGKDRGVDLVFSLPVGRPDWRWGQDIREEVPLSDGPHGQSSTTFSSVSAPTGGEGIALAVPADAPCDCEFSYDEAFRHAVRFHFGLSPEADGRLKSRAAFSLAVYRCDGRWGLRDAARRYYRFWPEAFAKRAAREGLWMFGSAKINVPDPENYAFHEGGPGDWEFDDAHGIYTCPYIIPGQREITGLAVLPSSKKEALEIFRECEPPTADTADRPGKTFESASAAKESKGWGHSVKEIIENCMLLDADGLPEMRIRNSSWGGNSITFPLSANPRLFADTDKPTVAKTLLAFAAAIHERLPGLDGMYVDSLGSWGDYLDHRGEHFRYAQVPLSYDPKTGQPVIPNRFSLLEFLWALGDQLHEQGKLLFANGVHPDRRFHFFALDVMGVEGHGRMEQKRVMAYQKPFLMLVYNIHDKPAEMEHYFHLATFYGIYPSFANMRVYETPEMYAPVAALNNRFVPVLRAITTAGWEPITHARSSRDDVWLERWGPDGQGNVFLTVYNASDKERRATLSIETSDLGLKGSTLHAADRLSDATWEAAVTGDAASIDVSVPPEQVRVLALKSNP